MENISLYRDFGLRYDQVTQSYILIDATDLDTTSDFSLANAGDDTGSALDASWLVRFETDGEVYIVYNRSFNFIFESKVETRFYFDPDIRVFDPSTGKLITDYIKILKINSKPDSAEALGLDYSMEIHNVFTESDGYEDTTKIKVTFPDSDQDGVPDDVDVFAKVVDPTVDPTNKFVFFTSVTDVDGYVRYEPVDSATINTDYTTYDNLYPERTLYNAGQLFFVTTEEQFFRLDVTGAVRTLTEVTNYTFKVGKGSLYFQYRHNSPNNRRIDPSPSNIIDLYVLTKTYDADYRAWVTDTTGKVAEPTAPTAEELRTEFGSLENYKPISDAILFSNATFKPLFGSKAASGLRATFKVVKNQSSTVSDSEIKSKMISAMNTFFELNNWYFGDTFYFSELSTYLHTALSPNVASIVLVPTGTGQTFGDLYQVDCNPNEIFISAATVDDITIIPAVTASQLNQI